MDPDTWNLCLDGEEVLAVQAVNPTSKTYEVQLAVPFMFRLCEKKGFNGLI